jgi:uroporphyrinogen decarboxylase
MSERTGTMTDRQRIEALLNHHKPDRVPVWPFSMIGFAAVYNNLPIAEAYNNPEASYAAQRKTCRDFGWVFFPGIGYAAFGAWEFGGEIEWPTGEFDMVPKVVRYPIEQDEDVYNLKWPTADSGLSPYSRRCAELARQERLDNEPFNATIGAGGSFTLAANIAGTDKFLRWLIKKPEIAHHLLKVVTDWRLAGLPKQREALGLDGVLAMAGGATESNQLISPKQFEEFALPSLKEVQEKVLALGYRTTFMHICGEQNANLPYWSQVSFGDPGIISIGHEVELATAAKYFPNDIILGNLNPSIVQMGTPDEVYESTRKIVEEGKKIEGGYIFSQGCDLPPRSPVENVRMMTQAVKDYGWYD